MNRVASALRVTEGQAYTVVTASLVAILLLVLGLPSLRTTPLDVAAPARTRTTAGPGEIVPDPVPIGSGFSDAVVPTPTTEPELSLEVPSAPLPASPGRRSSTTDVPVAEEPAGEQERELTVTFGRYASASGPLVPSGAQGSLLPVGLRLGGADKQSYVRLDGNSELLKLKVSGQAGHNFGDATVKACPIVSPGWDLADGAALTAGPPFDAKRCVEGKPGETEWSFAVGGVDAPDGFALVPVGGATSTFQIVFLGVQA